ncbi:hypothetical protein [Candidatus Nitrospira bockiana]
MIRRRRAAVVLVLACVVLPFPLPDVAALDSVWSTVLWDPLLPSMVLGVSVLSLKGDNGFQFAMLSAQRFASTHTRVAIGLGFDEMTQGRSEPVTGSGSGPASDISERLFLLHTFCDKRFQLTFQITW